MQKLLQQFFPYWAETEGMTVRVAPSFLVDQSRPRAGRWMWAYHVRIENHRESAARLLGRYWQITDGNGEVAEVKGDGVVGEQPMIAPGGSHDYVSGCPLTTAWGAMEGHYVMIGTDGHFQIAIPRFELKSEVPLP